jgi:hypothetical protein
MKENQLIAINLDHKIEIVLKHPKLGEMTIGVIYNDLGEAFNAERFVEDLLSRWPGNCGTTEPKTLMHPIDSVSETLNIGDRIEVVNPGEFLPSLKGMQGVITGGDAYTVEVRMDTITLEMEGFEDARTGIITFESKDIKKI